LVLVGTRDNLISAKLVNRLQANMKKVGVRCDLVYYEGQGHGFHGPNAAEWGMACLSDALRRRCIPRFARLADWTANTGEAVQAGRPRR
jgi:dienelactone hydrolase